MARDERVVVLGEDVRTMRRDLYLRFGGRRVRNTPISESAMLGTGLGAAMAGLRPVVEIMFVDFVPVAMDMLVNHVAKLAAFSGGRWRAPLVVRAACGGGYGDAGQHEQALWGMLAGVPGLSVVVPSTPADAAGPDAGRPRRSRPRGLPRAQAALAGVAGRRRRQPAGARAARRPAAGAVGGWPTRPEPVPLGVRRYGAGPGPRHRRPSGSARTGPGGRRGAGARGRRRGGARPAQRGAARP